MSFRDETRLRCPSCGCDSVETTEIEYKFDYGEGERAVTLSAVVPLRVCRGCGFQYLDDVAEDLQHEAVCRHLGVMTPAQIRGIRERAGGLTRSEFARLTKLGEATLGRWERGELTPNAAYDQLLYLLTFPENLERLRHRAEGAIVGSGPLDPALSVSQEEL